MLRNEAFSGFYRYATMLALGFLAAVISLPLWSTLPLGTEMIWGPDAIGHLAVEATTRRALSAGQLPHWNPNNYGGMPGLADVQNQTLYPPLLLLRWLPVAQFFSWGIFFHLWVAGAGVFLLCRQLGIARTAAIAGAIGFALCGSLPYRIEAGHFSVLHTASWIPFALALAVRSVASCRNLPHPGLVVVMTLQFLSGNPQIIVYTGVCIAAYYLFSMVLPRRSDRQAPAPVLCRQFVALVGLAGGLAAFQVLPTARFVQQSGRLMGLSYEDAIKGSLTWFDTFNIFFPFPNPGPNSALFVGVGLLAFVPLAVCLREQRRHSLFLFLMSTIALFFALGDALPFYQWHHAVLPSFRIPIRLLFFWSLGVTVLGAMGLDVVLRLKDNQKHLVGRLLPWLPTFVVILASVATAVLVFPSGGPVATAGTFLGTPFWLAGLAIGTVVVAGLTAQRQVHSAVGFLVVALLVCEGVVFTGRAVTQNSPNDVEAISALDRGTSGRVMTFCEGALSVTDVLLAGIPTVAGAGPLNLASYGRFLSLMNDAPFGQGNMQSDRPRADLLNLLNVTHVFTCEPMDDPGFSSVGQFGPIWVYRNLNVKPRAWLSCQTDPLPAGVVATRLFEHLYDPRGRLVPRPPPVHVTWAESLGPVARKAKEIHYGLGSGRYVEGTRWIYDLVNQGPENVLQLLADEAVVETNRIHPDGNTDRRADPGMATSTAFASAPASILVGGEHCDVQGNVVVETADRPDGVMRLLTETATGGLVFLSEPYYPEREGWLDGLPVRIERADLAFSAVAVPPGRHVIELRYVPLAFYWGIFLTALTAAAWLWMIRM